MLKSVLLPSQKVSFHAMGFGMGHINWELCFCPGCKQIYVAGAKLPGEGTILWDESDLDDITDLRKCSSPECILP